MKNPDDTQGSTLVAEGSQTLNSDSKSLTSKATMSTGTVCPYCNSSDFVKRGVRNKKHEVVQLYLCRNAQCGRTFTAERVKGKRFPLNVILEGISYYNLGLTLEQTCSLLGQKFPDIAAPIPATLSSWIEEYKPICRFERMRPYATKLFPPQKMIEVTTMAHRQLYRFRYHRAKTLLSMEEFKNRRFGRLKEYLDNVSAETPHQYFQDGERMSEIRSKFDKTDMIVKSKSNFANKTAEFVLRSVPDNQSRHDALQRFMIANDSVTIATEVPVYIRREDVEHMENELKFKITNDGLLELKGDKQAQKFPKLLTGHIDIVQIRNGMVHILDYKPNASKEKPIEQLTWYALALSRLTGLRLFEFKCAWFDDKDFYEFYPLHIVKKLQPSKRARKVRYRDGSVAAVPREDVFKVA
jgi:transposase-like protein